MRNFIAKVVYSRRIWSCFISLLSPRQLPWQPSHRLAICLKFAAHSSRAPDVTFDADPVGLHFLYYNIGLGSGTLWNRNYNSCMTLIGDVDPSLDYCWTSVTDGGPTIKRHMVNFLCLWGGVLIHNKLEKLKLWKEEKMIIYFIITFDSQAIISTANIFCAHFTVLCGNWCVKLIFLNKYVFQPSCLVYVWGKYIYTCEKNSYINFRS